MFSPNQNDFRRRLTRWLLIGISFVVVVAVLALVIQSGVQPASPNAGTPSEAELTQTMTALSEEAEAFYIIATALDTSLGGNMGMPFPEVDSTLRATDVVEEGTATPPANP